MSDTCPHSGGKQKRQEAVNEAKITGIGVGWIEYDSVEEVERCGNCKSELSRKNIGKAKIKQ